MVHANNKRKEGAHIYDQPLTAAFLEGDHRAFEQLVVLYRHSAVLFALRLTRDLSAAEDAVQEAFAYLWIHRERVRADASIKPLLFTLVRRRCMDWFRYWRRQSAFDGNADAADYGPEAVYANERTLALYNALQCLPPPDARVIHLLDIEGFSLREVSAILGKTQGAVKTAHHRAKQRLKRQLIEEDAIP